MVAAAAADGQLLLLLAALLLLPHMGDNERDCDVNNCVVGRTPSPEERNGRPRGCRWCLLQTLVVINHG
jgi:hypothetical protein